MTRPSALILGLVGPGAVILAVLAVNAFVVPGFALDDRGGAGRDLVAAFLTGIKRWPRAGRTRPHHGDPRRRLPRRRPEGHGAPVTGRVSAFQEGEGWCIYTFYALG